VLTNLTKNNDELEQTDVGISSLTDTWILCRDLEVNGERNRCVYVLKSRGMSHSNQIREFVMSHEGIRLIPPYVGSGIVLTGSSRVAQEAKEKADALVRSQEIEQRQEALERKRSALEAQIKVLNMDFDAEKLALERIINQQQSRERQFALERAIMNRIRLGSSGQTGDSLLAKDAGDAS
jgi:circadian clock protein KaiC